LIAGPVPAKAVVRVYPDDRVNLASLVSLAAAGLDQFAGLGRGHFADMPFSKQGRDRSASDSGAATGRQTEIRSAATELWH
jgi:hypothetical protein